MINLWVIFFMIFFIVSIYLLGLEYTNTEIQEESWLRTSAGIAGCIFTLYGLRLILRIKS